MLQMVLAACFIWYYACGSSFIIFVFIMLLCLTFKILLAGDDENGVCSALGFPIIVMFKLSLLDCCCYFIILFRLGEQPPLRIIFNFNGCLTGLGDFYKFIFIVFFIFGDKMKLLIKFFGISLVEFWADFRFIIGFYSVGWFVCTFNF